MTQGRAQIFAIPIVKSKGIETAVLIFKVKYESS